MLAIGYEYDDETRILDASGPGGGFGAAYVMMQSLVYCPFRAAASKSVLQKFRPRETCCNSRRRIAAWCGLGTAEGGYSCTILEARGRRWGRNWTIRKRYAGRNDRRHNANLHLRTTTTLNAGPARLPSQHVTMLGYCASLVLQLEGRFNSSRSSLLQNDKFNDAKPCSNGSINDTLVTLPSFGQVYQARCA